LLAACSIKLVKSVSKIYACITNGFYFLQEFSGHREVIGVKVVTVHLPEAYIEAIDQLVKKKLYPNRAEAIRMAVRDFIMEEAMISE